MSKRFFFVLMLIVSGFLIVNMKGTQKSYVNVYDWYGMLPKEILDQFEEETGIRVRYDMFDNNEVLEAKLLASNSGYDVVFPSAVPYAARQVEAGVYQPVNWDKIPNAKDIKPFLMNELTKVDEKHTFLVPHAWGTTGIIYDVDKVKAALGNVTHSYHLIFDPTVVQKIAKLGISYLEEPIDVFPLVLRFLGKDPDSTSTDDLQSCYKQLMKVRPYIKRFTSSRMINDLILGEVAVAQIWSAEACRTIEDAKEVGRNLAYFVPDEGASLWIDVIAIPIGAPNIDNAHKFINFILRPDINARITNLTSQPLSNEKATAFVDERLKNNTGLYPTKELLKKLTIDRPQTTEEDRQFDRERLRIWAKVRQNKGDA